MSKRNHRPFQRHLIHELFSDAELEGVINLACDSVFRAFERATETHRGKKRGTDNYIVGIGPRQILLAQYIAGSVKKPFIKLETLMLPPQLVGLSRHYYDRLTDHLQQRAIELAINALCSDHTVWYDDNGVWNVCQSAMDEWRKSNRRVQRTLKYDRRSWHGKPRNQARRRGIPAGANNSVTYAT